MNCRLLASTLLLALALPAQQPTAAETAFRDAWWAESGQNDLALALHGYLAAAAAEGPADIRAKALLAAGSVQQRLGKTESAIATFKQLLQQFPGETDLVERARTHLRELTAIDLRQGYDEWYQRRLFSEEVQLQILQQIEALGGKLAAPPRDNKEVPLWSLEISALCREITGHGAGAVPALQKASQSANDALAGRAVDMLFQLGDLPPAGALQRSFGGWATEATNWSQLLALPRDRAASLRAGLRADATGADLLAAALQGPAPLLAAVTATTDVELVQDHPEIVAAVTTALLRAGADSRGKVLARLTDESVPMRVRQGMELSIVEADAPLPFSTGEWLALGAEPLHYRLRLQSLEAAARLLQAGDGSALDEILVRVASAPASTRQEWLARLVAGLERNLAPLQVPWTLPRLRALVRMFAAADAELSPVLLALQRTDKSRSLLVEALLGDPVPMREVYTGEPATLRQHLQFGGDEDEMTLLATRWHRALAGQLSRGWPDFDAGQRLAALALLDQAMSPDFGERQAVLQALQQFVTGASEDVRAAIEALQLRWHT